MKVTNIIPVRPTEQRKRGPKSLRARATQTAPDRHAAKTSPPGVLAAERLENKLDNLAAQLESRQLSVSEPLAGISFSESNQSFAEGSTASLSTRFETKGSVQGSLFTPIQAKESALRDSERLKQKTMQLIWNEQPSYQFTKCELQNVIPGIRKLGGRKLNFPRACMWNFQPEEPETPFAHLDSSRNRSGSHVQSKGKAGARPLLQNSGTQEAFEAYQDAILKCNGNPGKLMYHKKHSNESISVFSRSENNSPEKSGPGKGRPVFPSTNTPRAPEKQQLFADKERPKSRDTPGQTRRASPVTLPEISQSCNGNPMSGNNRPSSRTSSWSPVKVKTTDFTCSQRHGGSMAHQSARDQARDQRRKNLLFGVQYKLEIKKKPKILGRHSSKPQDIFLRRQGSESKQNLTSGVFPTAGGSQDHGSVLCDPRTYFGSSASGHFECSYNDPADMSSREMTNATMQMLIDIEHRDRLEMDIVHSHAANVPSLCSTLAGTSNNTPLNSTARSHSPNDEEVFPADERRGSVSSLPLGLLIDPLDKAFPPKAVSLGLTSFYATQLNLSHQGIGDERARILAGCLSELHYLEYLNVSDNRLTDKSLAPILDNLSHRHDLQRLNLSQNKMDMEASDALMAYLSNSHCSLTTLELSKSDIDDDECCRLVEALSRSPNLTSLDLSHNLIGKKESKMVSDYTTGAQALAESLSYSNCRLRYLDLSWNFIRLESAVALGEVLAENKELTELNISYNSFGRYGGEALGKSLYRNKTLQALDVSQNNITPRAAFVIAIALRFNEGLRRIDLNGNPLGEYGGKALMALSFTAHHRIEIGLQKCNFTYKDNECWFNPENPEGGERKGEFSLDMSDAYQSAVMFDILRLASREEGMRIVSLSAFSTQAESTVQLKRKRVDESFEHEFDRIQIEPEKYFQEFDKNKDGAINLHELIDLFHFFHLKESDKQIGRIMSYYDRDDNKAIDFEEFVDVMNFVVQECKEKERTCRVLTSVDNPNTPWLPDPYEKNLILKVKVSFDRIYSDDYDVLTHDQICNVMFICEEADNPAKMIEFTLGQVKLQTEEAQKVYENLTQEYGSKEKAMQAILPSMAEPIYARLLLKSNIESQNSMKHLRNRLGITLPVLLGVYSGRYRLDLSNSYDRLAFKKLVEINNKEKRDSKERGGYDTSQNGTWDNFRNVRYNMVKVDTISRDFMNYPPQSGWLHFDYISTTRPPPQAQTLSFNRFCRILIELGLLTEEEKQELLIVGSLNPVTSHTSVQTYKKGRQTYIQICQDLKEKTPVANETKPPYFQLPTPPSEDDKASGWTSLRAVQRLTKGSTMRGTQAIIRRTTQAGTGNYEVSRASSVSNPGSSVVISEEGCSIRSRCNSFVELSSASPEPDILAPLAARCNNEPSKELAFNIQMVLLDYYFTAQQVRYMLLRFNGTPEERVDTCVTAFSRIVDLRNFDSILEIFSQDEQGNIISRIGILNIFNPLKPDGYIEFDLTRREEKQLGRILIMLALIEPGANFTNQSYYRNRYDQPFPGWDLPDGWQIEEKYPSQGVIITEYFSGEGKGLGGCWPQVELRLVLTQLAVLCEVDPVVAAQFSELPLDKGYLETWIKKAQSSFDFRK